MRSISAIGVDGLPSEGSPVSVSAPEMSLLHALDPVQTWLGQELEKCGIDAMIYSRYILSLLLQDSYDYDLQEQENDIFLGWEKGVGKRWGKSKKKSSDLSLEEMKKQAAVQCLRSASDESSGIETLVEELCSRLKDLQNTQEEKLIRKSEGCSPPEVASFPAARDQVEMYYEAFPPLSEKPVCQQEAMTVWNKSKVCAYSSSSSSSAAPQTSTDTSSPKDCNSENEVTRERENETSCAVSERAQQGRSKKEKENLFNNNLAEDKHAGKKQIRLKSEGKMRPRSWSSGSSEAGSSSSGNHHDLKTQVKCIKIRHKARDIRSKRNKNGQTKLSLKTEREEKKTVCGSSSSNGSVKQQLCKRGKRPLKEIRRRDTSSSETKDLYFERRDKEYKEEPLWYTEPITEYFVPLSRSSKLETKYRNILDTHDVSSTSEAVEKLSESMYGLCISNSNTQKTYLAAGTFIDGHYVEMPAVIDEVNDLNGTSNSSQVEDSNNLDVVHPSELAHFYEVDIYQSILDSSASDMIGGESRILNMIRQKSNEKNDFEADCCIVLDGMALDGESAIWTDSPGCVGADEVFFKDLANIAQFWECCTPSSSCEADGESFGGDSPVGFSPVLDNTVFNASTYSGAQDLFPEVNEGPSVNSSFSVFEVQYDNSLLPFPFDALNLGNENIDCGSSGNILGKTQSRLLIWTKNSAFDENEHCSNLSTRTCSPWSYSEETRSDNETVNIQSEESVPFITEEVPCMVPRISSCCLEGELLDLFHEETCQETNRATSDVTGPGVKRMAKEDARMRKSKLESVCGIQLEQKTGGKEYETYEAAEIFDELNQHGENCGSEVKNIWTVVTDSNCGAAVMDQEITEDQMFTSEVNSCHCCCLDMEANVEVIQDPQNKAVQRSEYHLWEAQKENTEERVFIASDLAKTDGGDYTTPLKPWDINSDRESAFILGGVYGELKTFHSDGDWAVIPPSQCKGSLLQCAASDVVTIAGTDVFMTPGNSIAPGHRPLWRPFVSFEHSEQGKNGEDVFTKGFSLIFHEDLLGACSNFQNDEPGLEYSFSSFDMKSPFSQVLHVECSFERDGIASFSPSFKPKSILCSSSDGEAFHQRIYGVDRTQYRAIRISPRTHFRPISASELSPTGDSESEFESEKEDTTIQAVSQPDVFEDPQADLKPLEEDAEREGHYYGKSELESGKFLPRLVKSGMEKSAQTSLDSQEGSVGVVLNEQEQLCLNCSVLESVDKKDVKNHKSSSKRVESSEKIRVLCDCKTSCRFSGYEEKCITAPQLKEVQHFPSVNIHVQEKSTNLQEECWWEKAVYSPLFPRSQYTECYTNTREKFSEDSCPDMKENSHNGELLQPNMTTATHDAYCMSERNSETRPNEFHSVILSSGGSVCDEITEGANEWAEHFSRTKL
ncbi:uncharacterized protein KIAA0232 homolog isoform X2 [Protopterus annectens]|uniref:uncharacterized protein KIAA0232 homolog isoform X2 n=1 Tax=Protopterus annectens TaxID=7888 RepID=UPI001CFB83E5|nr:uncharacterized protein KIAA0232 homolog isoform X2 [Protopterus annectens]